MASEPDKVEIFDVPKRTTVKVAESPTTLTDYKEIPIAKFCAKEGFQWTESVLGSTSKKRTFEANKNKDMVQEAIVTGTILNTVESLILDYHPLSNPQYPPNQAQLLSLLESEWKMSSAEISANIKRKIRIYNQEIQNLLANIERDLVICFINQQVGKGVFLSPQAKAIQQNELVLMYSGEYKTANHEDYNPYRCETFPHSIHSEDSSSTTILKGMIDATHLGNESRYLQDLPTEEDLRENYTLPPAIAAQVATANLRGILCLYNGYPVVVFQALRDIQPGEQLGFSYSTIYWAKALYLHGTKRCLFNKTGSSIIDAEAFINYLHLHFKNSERNYYFTFSLKQLSASILSGSHIELKAVGNTIENFMLSPNEFIRLCKESMAALKVTLNNNFKLFIEVIDVIEKLQQPDIFYTDKFVLNVKYTLLKHLTEHLFNTDGHSQQKSSYIQKLQTAVVSENQSDANAVFKALNRVLKDANCERFYKTQLALLRSELIKLMRKYNDDLQNPAPKPLDETAQMATKRK